jgi:hypothetical protein
MSLTTAYGLVSEFNKTYGHVADVYRYTGTTSALGQTTSTSLTKVYSGVSLTYKARRFPPKELTAEGIDFKNYYDASINAVTNSGTSVTLQDKDKIYIGTTIYDVIKPKLEPFGYIALLVRQV